MDCSKVGKLLYTLRQEKCMTQKQLSEMLNISDKTISKWERGLGCPDVSLLPELSKVFGVNIEKILAGNITANDPDGGNMKRIKFYVCPECGNIITSTGQCEVSCCGRRLSALEAVKADEDHDLKMETIENEWFISSDHGMVKEHYISFVALVTGDKVLFAKQYPEWDMHLRMPKLGHGRLYSYCTRDGLFYKNI